MGTYVAGLSAFQDLLIDLLQRLERPRTTCGGGVSCAVSKLREMRHGTQQRKDGPWEETWSKRHRFEKCGWLGFWLGLKNPDWPTTVFMLVEAHVLSCCSEFWWAEIWVKVELFELCGLNTKSAVACHLFLDLLWKKLKTVPQQGIA